MTSDDKKTIADLTTALHDVNKRLAEVTGQTDVTEQDLEEKKRVVVADNQGEDQDSKASRDFCMNLLGTPEFYAFMDAFDEEENPRKYNKGVFEAAWIQHCRGIELGVTAPLANQEPTEQRRFLDSAKNNGASGAGTGKVLSWNQDAKQWITGPTVEKDSTGLTRKWDREKKCWVT